MTRMISKNVHADAKDSLSVSPDIRAILPDIMIEYLWGLAFANNWQKCDSQIFELKVGKLGGRNIQNVYHSGYGNNSLERRQVYGVEPSNCVLQVINSQGCYQMQLCMSQ